MKAAKWSLVIVSALIMIGYVSGILRGGSLLSVAFGCLMVALWLPVE